MSKSFDRYPYLKTSNAAPQKQSKKLTFEEWFGKFNENGHETYADWFCRMVDSKRAWEAGQENK